MWRFTKCIQRLVRAVARPSQYPTAHLMDLAALGKETLYTLGSGVRSGAVQWGRAPSHAAPDNRQPSTPSPTTPKSLDTKLSPAVAPKNMAPLPSSDACTPYLISHRLCIRADTPSQQFCICWSGGQPYRKLPSGFPAPPGDRQTWAMREGYHRHRSLTKLKESGLKCNIKKYSFG